MDKLKDKSSKTYNYISRYSPFPYYYNTLDDKYIYGVTKAVSKKTSYTMHKVEDYDTLDLLANKYYGRPDLFWIIADFNNILDPLIDITKKFDRIKIPSLNNLHFGDD